MPLPDQLSVPGQLGLRGERAGSASRQSRRAGGAQLRGASKGDDVRRLMCLQVIKLSDAVQHLPREQTLFVHGVPPCFLSVGDRTAAAARQVTVSLP